MPVSSDPRVEQMQKLREAQMHMSTEDLELEKKAISAVKIRLSAMKKDELLSKEERSALSSCNNTILFSTMFVDALAAGMVSVVATRFAKQHRYALAVTGALITHDWVSRRTKDYCVQGFMTNNYPNSSELRNVYRKYSPQSPFLQAADAMAELRSSSGGSAAPAYRAGQVTQSRSSERMKAAEDDSDDMPRNEWSSGAKEMQASAHDSGHEDSSFDADEYFGRSHSDSMFAETPSDDLRRDDAGSTEAPVAQEHEEEFYGGSKGSDEEDSGPRFYGDDYRGDERDDRDRRSEDDGPSRGNERRSSRDRGSYDDRDDDRYDSRGDRRYRKTSYEKRMEDRQYKLRRRRGSGRGDDFRD